MFYNANRDREMDPNGIDWQDVFPEWKEIKEQGEDEMFETMQMLVKTTQAIGEK